MLPVPHAAVGFLKLGVPPTAPFRVAAVGPAVPDTLHPEAIPRTPQPYVAPTWVPSRPPALAPNLADDAPEKPGMLVRGLHAFAMFLMIFPPIAALLCAASYIGPSLAAQWPALLANVWLRGWLVAETAHFLWAKLAARLPGAKPPGMQSAERLSLWRACLSDPTITVRPRPFHPTHSGSFRGLKGVSARPRPHSPAPTDPLRARTALDPLTTPRGAAARPNSRTPHRLLPSPSLRSALPPLLRLQRRRASSRVGSCTPRPRAGGSPRPSPTCAATTCWTGLRGACGAWRRRPWTQRTG